MKPLMLEFEAFLSYKDKTIIDFTKFDNCLFLIDGKTGSGKTTIFDAMSYALYARVSGNRGNNLKSDYALDSTVPYVIFTFLQEGKKYTIKRCAKFKKSTNKNETGETVEFITPTKTFTKKTEADNAILDVIKFSFDQFGQTMMIAQGKFSKLVESESKDRSKLFREILQTEKFQEFQDKIKNKYLDEKNQISKEESNIKTLVKQFDLDGELNLKLQNENYVLIENKEFEELMDKEFVDIKSRITELSKEYDDKNNNVKKLNNLIQKIKQDNSNKQLYDNIILEQNELKQKENEFNEKTNIIKTYNNSKQVIEKYNNYQEKDKDYINKLGMYKENENQFLIVKPEYEKAKTSLLKVKNNDELITKNTKEIEQLKVKSDRFNEKLRLEKDLLNSKKKLNDYKINQEKILKEIDDITKKEDEIKKYQSEHENVNSDIVQKENEIEKIDLEINNLNKINNEYNKYLNDVNKLNENEEKIKHSFDELKKKNNLKTEIENKYYQNISCVLRGKLKANTPCPVCGSLEHPNKTIDSSYDVTEDTLKKINKELDDIKNDYTLLLSEYNTLKNSLETKLTEIKDELKTKEDNIKDIINSKKEELLLLKGKCNNELLNLNSILTTVKNNKEQLKNIENNLKNKNQLKENNSTNITKENANINNIEEKINEINIIIKDLNIDTINDEIKTKEEDNTKLKEENDKLNKDYHELDIRCNTLSSTISSISKELPSLKERKEKSYEIYNNELINSDLKDLNKINQFLLVHQEREINNLAIETEEYKRKVERSSTLIENYKSLGYDKIEVKDTNQKEIELKELEDNVSNIIALNTKLKSRLDNNLRIYKRYKELFNDISSKQKYVLELSELNDVASAQVNGKAKINFETFYQAKLFNNILLIASKKLESMTDGVYQMRRHEQTEADKTTNTSLDIDIFDRSTNKLRTSASLSGGEKFMAALSLALGFAEISRNRVGSRELDCMFIDEGFGTLDQDSLNYVTKVLKELSYNSSKMIGIISHVEQLSEQISKKINVIKSDNGSKIVIEA